MFGLPCVTWIVGICEKKVSEPEEAVSGTGESPFLSAVVTVVVEAQVSPLQPGLLVHSLTGHVSSRSSVWSQREGHECHLAYREAAYSKRLHVLRVKRECNRSLDTNYHHTVHGRHSLLRRALR